MSSRYPPDIIDGVEVPPLVVTSETVLDGVHKGSGLRRSGTVRFGRHTPRESERTRGGSTATITGRQQGSVHLAPGASVRVVGAIEGSTHVSPGANVVVEGGGKLAGSLHNDGDVIVRGVFGGSRSGSGRFVLDGGIIKEPRMKDGIYYYDWDVEVLSDDTAANPQTTGHTTRSDGRSRRQ